MTARLVEGLSEQERQQLFGWGTNIFGTEGFNLQWRKKKSWHILVYDVASQLVSHVGVAGETVSVGQRIIHVGGIGGVVTIPLAQNKGYARTALEHAKNFMCDRLGVEFGMLFCLDRLVPFYQRLGWQRVQDSVYIEQPAGKILSPLNVMILPCQSQIWPTGTVDVQSLPW
ncbi:GNAT family N-acetyltransferase [Candidatus Acetothermia bacterium]|nr:GNAT family N-acetyltransferase [Candidatus Acetothermia bacterium]